MSASASEGLRITILIILIGLYFVPLIVAAIRKVPNIGSIAVINIFLGWSLVGWVVSLAMASRSATPAGPVQQVFVQYGPMGVPGVTMPPAGASATAAPPQVQQRPRISVTNQHAAGQHPASQHSAAGWKSDPLGRHQLRYWDGSVWTSNVSNNGTMSLDPVN